MERELLDKVNTALGAFDAQGQSIKTMERQIDALAAQLHVANQAGLGRKAGIWASEKSAKEFVEFNKAVFLGNVTKSNEMSEGTAADGGYLVPPEWRMSLVSLLETYGVVRQNATIIPMSKDELSLPSLTAGPTVYWPGENGVITNSKPTLGYVTLTAKKLAALVIASNELMADASISVATVMADTVARAMAAEEDRVALVGSYPSPDVFDGIIYTSNVGTISLPDNSGVGGTDGTSFLHLTADDLLDMTSDISTAAASGASFVMHRTIFNLVRKLKNDAGDFIYEKPAGPDMPFTIWGYPVVLSEAMPAISADPDPPAATPFIIFGNLRHLYFGDRQSMVVAMSPHTGFAYDQQYLRYTERFAISVAIPTAFTVLYTQA